MKLANNIVLRVFAKPEEDKDKIKSTFFKFAGLSELEIEEKKINYEERKVKGFNDRTIRTFSVSFDKDRYCNKILQKLSENLSLEDKQLLISQTNRLDDDLNFYLRLDKNELLNEVFSLTDSGDCFHIKINVASFPKNKMEGHKKIKEIFS